MPLANSVPARSGPAPKVSPRGRTRAPPLCLWNWGGLPGGGCLRAFRADRFARPLRVLPDGVGPAAWRTLRPPEKKRKGSDRAEYGGCWGSWLAAAFRGPGLRVPVPLLSKRRAGRKNHSTQDSHVVPHHGTN